MNGYIDNAPLGLICSRQYAEWMLSMNEKLDFPAESYYMLVRLFSRPQYQAFFDEENRKGNNFVYHHPEKELSDTCRQIGEGLAVHVKVEIDTNNGAGMDCDFDDLKTAPVGLTNEDYERFSDMD